MNKTLKFALMAVATIIIANGCDRCSKAPEATDAPAMDAQPVPSETEAPPPPVEGGDATAPADAPPPPAEVPEGGTQGQ